MSSTSVTFNGSSTYSSAFQQAITRAVGIASLPIQVLQNDVTTLTGQQSAATSLGSGFQTVQSSLQSLATLSSGTPTAQVSGSGISAVASTGALAGTYTIQVDDPGSSSVLLSSNGLTTVTDPSVGNIDAATSYTFTLNGEQTTITPAGSSLTDLATAINAANAGAQATIVNVGSNTSPDYRLSITSSSLGSDVIQLNDGTNDLLDTLSTGTPALYRVNGSPTDVQSTSSQITLSPGLTVDLLAQSDTPATITVSNSFAGLEAGLSNFVSSFNSAVTALQKNEGSNGGALSGDSIVYTLVSALNQIAEYSGSGSAISSLADLGVTLQQNGQLSFDPSAFDSLNPADVQEFLGSLDSASGFLSTANNSLTAITDANNGLIAGVFNSFQTQIAAKNSSIADDQQRVDDLQTSLQAQLARADAAIATLESQKTYFAELFTATYGNGTFSTTGG